ncbi:hypothetical protein KR044_006511, partial [Drosophila immigrans]
MDDNIMSEKAHRVVVSLTDAIHNLPRSIQESLFDSKVNILDNTRLMMRMGGGEINYQQMQFDAVGYEDDAHVRCELNELMVQMFRQQRNCCLLRLTPRRSHNVKLMSRLLVSNVDKVLEKLPYQLLGINVEYHDLRKFDMVNMLSTQSRGRLQSRREMQNTRDMFHWLHNEYSAVRGRGTGDDYINIEFVLGEGYAEPKCVNLAIFNIFDCNGRTDIGNFFKELPSGKLAKNSLLTDCIKESFDLNRNIFTVVLCEMPLDRESAREMHKFLRLANTAFTFNEAVVEAARSTQSLPSGSLHSDNSYLPHPTRQRSSRTNTKYLRCRPLNLSHDDHNKLASWYQRIDKKFDEVKVCMKRHYNVQYRQKFLKICKQLKNFSWLQEKSGGDAGRLMLQHSIRDEAITSKYIEMLRQFRQLEEEVKRSPFACTLSTYMSTKNYALVNAEKLLQNQEIANLQ